MSWILSPFTETPNYQLKRMFGCQAIYRKEKLVLVTSDSDEPWNGLMLPVEREFHLKILKSYPELAPHPILGKWLYLSQTHPKFEDYVQKIQSEILNENPNFGVIPKPKKPRKSK